MKYARNILITGGAGFIGSHVVRLFVKKYPHYRVVNLDKLTYAGNLANLADVERAPNYFFEKADICDFPKMRELFEKYAIDGVIHLAAESHVDRSIKDPFTFARTNVFGTLALLQAARERWDGNFAGKLFYHISTDEVYGALEMGGGILPRKRNTRRTVRIRRAKRRATISSARFTILTDCRRSSRIVRTTTDRFSFRKS